MSWKNKMKHVLQYKESCVISKISNLAIIISELWKQMDNSIIFHYFLEDIKKAESCFFRFLKDTHFVWLEALNHLVKKTISIFDKFIHFIHYFQFFTWSAKSAFFTKSAISALVDNFFFANLPAILSVVNLLNSSVV